MSRTIHVEQREGEQWKDVTAAFLQFCLQEKKVTRAGCHEGDPAPRRYDGRIFAAVSIPDHSLHLIGYLKEWAGREGRAIQDEEKKTA